MTITNTSNGYVTANSSANAIVVNAVSGDAFAKAFGPFDVLKVDVEGFEGTLLQGCVELLAHRPRLALEIHAPELARYGSSIQEILDLIRVADYEGTMFTRPEYFSPRPFDAKSLPSDSITNVFLCPR